MTSNHAKRLWALSAVAVLLASIGACAHSETGPAPAAPAASAPVASTAANAPPAPAPASTPPPVTASAASAGSLPASAAEAGEDEASEALVEHHRHHHRGGVVRFIAMSLATLGVSAEQGAALKKVQADLKDHLRPVREADEKLQKTLADAATAGTFDERKVQAAVADVEHASSAAHTASLAALDKLHEVLTPEQRAALVDKVRAHWEVWQEANRAGEKSGGGGGKHPHLADLKKELDLTPEQVDKIEARLGSAKAGPPFDAAKVEAHIKAFETAFEGDKFEAKTLAIGKDASGHMAGWGAERMARFVEAVASVVGADQRAKLAHHLSEHTGHEDEPGEEQP